MKTKTPNHWTIEKLGNQVHRLTFAGMRSGDERWALLMSDEHWDNKECDRALLTRHHKEAQERNAPIFKFGDTFCAMQGKWDKRADQNQLRDEHRGNNYLDRLVKTADDYYSPFADNIALMSSGNHEGSIMLRHQTNLLERLNERLREKSDVPQLNNEIWGFVQFRFVINSKMYLTKTLFYHHGYGGGGEVTRGLIDNNRTRGQYDADIFYSGHIHRRNMDENIITGVTSQGRIFQRQQLFLRGGTYKNEAKGYHANNGRAGRPLGGYWLRFTLRRTHKDEVLDVQEIRAT